MQAHHVIPLGLAVAIDTVALPTTPNYLSSHQPTKISSLEMSQPRPQGKLVQLAHCMEQTPCPSWKRSGQYIVVIEYQPF
ncbi:hypothetical protein GQ53DRAFT_752039 [Thozetella sp. PMI_491]|nr:hypothetical protein GQ53DRAFT_752039 [Thozetella sp. PMI_491]